MAVNQEKNFGDPNGGYPSAADMPEIKMGDKPPAADQGPNPVVDAFETIAKFVMSLEQKGSPNAAQAKDTLKSLMQAVVGDGQTQDMSKEPADGEKEAMPPAKLPEDGQEPAIKPKASNDDAKGFDPFKDPSMDGKEVVPEESEYPDSGVIEKDMMKKKMKNKPTSIQPLA